MHRDLDDAIYLLASITERPPDPEGVNQESEPSDSDIKSESDLDDETSDDIQDPTVLDTDSKGDQYLTELKNQFLDKLAEILARFKTDPNTKKSCKTRNSQDAKHFSAAMMVCYKKYERVKIFCAKNDGLNHEDRKFLNEWKQRMEEMAKKVRVRFD